MTKRPSILLLSNRDDLTTDFIASKLHEQGTEYIRINSEDITEREFTIVPNKSIWIGSGDSEVSLNFINSIYFRRIPSVFLPDQNQSHRNFINRERKDFLEGLSLCFNAYWLNPLWATLAGERKIFQLMLAKEIGLRPPETIVSNNPKKVSEFIDKYIDVIIKPITHGFLVEGGEAFSIYTSTLDRSAINSMDQLFEAPVLVQQKIATGLDIRATIVGENVYSVAIEKEDKTAIDWRRPELKKNFNICDLPIKLQKKLILLNQRLGLTYSAIDLIQQKDEEFYFLEVNPVGEWLWLELELGLPISDDIIHNLTDKR